MLLLKTTRGPQFGGSRESPSPARYPLASPRLHDDAPRHAPASCAQRRAAPRPRAVSGTTHPLFCTACQRLTPTALLPALPRPPTPPASAPAPAGYTSARALAPAPRRSFCKGSAALAKSPGLCSCQALPQLYPTRTRLYPPVHRSAGTPLLERTFLPRRTVLLPGRSGEPTFQRRLLLLAPHLAACRDPGRGAAARRLWLGSRSRPLLQS